MTDDTSNDDDDGSTGGPISYWLKYKLYHKVPGWVVVVLVFIAGVAAAKL